MSAAPAFGESPPPNRPPNIVLIIGDDLGYPYAGFMGSHIVQTPNLDRLAAEGTTFTHGFSTASVCNPALQTLLTGLHPRAWSAQRDRLSVALGVPFWFHTEIEHYVTLARQLSRQGYRTFQGGKHWEDTFVRAGFDAGTMAVPILNEFTSPTWYEFGRRSLQPLHDFLDGIEEDEPFFLYLAPMLPHTPHDPPPDLVAYYESLNLWTSAVYYYANITRFDQVVGQMIEALEERGLRDNSLIIYVSDNGWEQGTHDESPFLRRNLGGDRGKLSIYEFGFRTPLIFNWPGRVPANTVLDDLVTFADLHATILQYGGAPIPPDHEGNTLIPRIEGWGEPARDQVSGIQTIFRARESEYVPPWFLTIDPASYLRTDEWRYIEWLTRGEQALFRIEDDPYERNDLSAAYPELVAEFAKRNAAWREALARPAAWMDLIGRLHTEDGTPGTGLRLWLAGADESGFKVRLQIFSDEGGFFRFPNVPAGEYNLTYEIEAQGSRERWWGIRTEPVTNEMEVDLVGYVTGPFLSIKLPGDAPPPPTNDPRPGTIEIEFTARSKARTVGLPVLLQGLTARGLVKQRVLSGPDGFVAVDKLPTGFYIITVRAPGRIQAKTRWVYLRPGEHEFLEIAVRQEKRRRKSSLKQGRTKHRGRD